jgi:peroxiredoxin
MVTPEELKQKVIRKAWEDEKFKAKLLSDPKTAIKEAFNIEVPAHFKIQAMEETDNQFYVVIPKEPSLVLAGVGSSPVMMW